MREDFLEKLKDRFRDKYNKELNLINPNTFNEKILKINTELSEEELGVYTKCTDKYLVRNFFIERLGKDIGVPIEYVLEEPLDLKKIKFDVPHIIKCNHASGFNFVCESGFVNTKTIDLIISCMRTPWYTSAYEMWYKDIERKLVIEKLLPNMRDIKVFCVDGKAKLYEISYIKGRIEYSIGSSGHPTLIRHIDRSPDNRQSYYDMDWNYIPDLVRVKYPAPLKEIDKKPLQLDLMKKYSEELSKGFKFVRVDFIVSDDEFYCEELTFAPGGGFSPFKGNGDELMYNYIFG